MLARLGLLSLLLVLVTPASSNAQEPFELGPKAALLIRNALAGSPSAGWEFEGVQTNVDHAVLTFRRDGESATLQLGHTDVGGSCFAVDVPFGASEATQLAHEPLRRRVFSRLSALDDHCPWQVAPEFRRQRWTAPVWPVSLDLREGTPFYARAEVRVGALLGLILLLGAIAWRVRARSTQRAS